MQPAPMTLQLRTIRERPTSRLQIQKPPNFPTIPLAEVEKQAFLLSFTWSKEFHCQRQIYSADPVGSCYGKPDTGKVYHTRVVYYIAS